MRPVMQQQLGVRGDCFAACLASLLEVPLEAVPAFPDWWEQARAWLAGQGLEATYAPASDPGYPLSVQRWRPKGWTVLACETGGGAHAVVACDGAIAHDPRASLRPLEPDPWVEGWYLLSPVPADGAAP